MAKYPDGLYLVEIVDALKRRVVRKIIKAKE